MKRCTYRRVANTLVVLALALALAPVAQASGEPPRPPEFVPYLRDAVGDLAPIRRPDAIGPALSMTVSDSFGATDDRLVPADGTVRVFTVRVTDGAAPVSGAAITKDTTTLALTDATGTASISLTTATTNQTVSLTASKAGYTAATIGVDEVAGGSGIIAVHTALPYFELNLFGPGGQQGLGSQGRYTVATGAYTAVLAGKDAAGAGYLLELGTVTVVEQAVVVVSVDAVAMAAAVINLTVSAGGTPVVQADVALGNQRLRSSVRQTVRTDSHGVVSYRVFPGGTEPYMARVGGGTSPKVLGRFANLTVGDHVLDFAGSPQLTVTAVDASGNPLTALTLVATDAAPIGEGGTISVDQGAGTHLVRPGRYYLQAQFQQVTGTEQWTYAFTPTNLSSDGWLPVDFVAGDLPRTFAAGGQVLPRIGTDLQAKVGSEQRATFRLVGSSSELQYSAGVNTSPFQGLEANPLLEVRDAAGQLVKDNRVASKPTGWPLRWIPTSTGIYTITGTLSSAGPYVPSQVQTTQTVLVSDAYSFAVTPPWVTHDSQTPITVVGKRNGNPVDDAVIELPLFGDVNGDNAIDAGDLDILVANYLAQFGGNPYLWAMDATQDGFVDQTDLYRAARNAHTTPALTPAQIGSAAVTVRGGTEALPAPTHPLLGVFVRSPDGSFVPVRWQWVLLNPTTDTRITLGGLPLGTYWIGLMRTPDQPFALGLVTVPPGGTGTLTLTPFTWSGPLPTL